MALVGHFDQINNGSDEPTNIEAKDNNIAIDKNTAQTYTDIEMYANEVIAQIISDKLPVLPNTYNIYFQRHLDSKDKSFQDKINRIMDIEDPTNEEKMVNLEKSVKKNLSYIKRMINHSLHLYKNTHTLKEIVKKSENDISNTNIINASSTLHSLKKELTKSSNDSSKYLNEIRDLYKKSKNILLEVGENSEYDNEYDLHSKNYLLKELKKEQVLSKSVNYNSSIIFIKLHSSISSKIGSLKIKKHMSRLIAKLLHKNSKRSDTIAHYGNDLFVVLMPRTDLVGAQMTAKRVKLMLRENSIFVGDNEYELNVALGVGLIRADVELKTILECIANALKKANKDMHEDFISCEDI